MEKSFIRRLPDGENAAVDESLLWLQVRVRKRTEWEKSLRQWLKESVEND